MEAVDGVLGILPNILQEAANADDYGTSWNSGAQRNVVDGELHFISDLACCLLY